MIPRCKECQNAKMQDMNGRPNRWFCEHPKVEVEDEDTD